MSPSEPDRPLDNFEAQLAALQPSASGVDRDQLLYEAGRAAASAELRRSRMPLRWLSPLATVASVSLAVLFAGLWWNEVSRPTPQIAQPETPPAAPLDEPEEIAIVQFDSPQQSYFHSRQVALTEGVEAWPVRVPIGTGASPPNARSAWPPSDG